MPRSPRQNAIAKLHNVRRPRNILVGADDPVRPWGNCEFAVAFHKNGRAPYGSMWASTPTNILRVRRWYIRFCRCVLPGGQRRPPLRVRAGSHGANKFAALYRREGQATPLRYDETRQQLKTYHPSPHQSASPTASPQGEAMDSATPARICGRGCFYPLRVCLAARRACTKASTSSSVFSAEKETRIEPSMVAGGRCIASKTWLRCPREQAEPAET